MPDDPKVGVHVKLPADQLAKIDRMSEGLQINRSLMITLLLSAALDNPESLTDLIRKHAEKGPIPCHRS